MIFYFFFSIQQHHILWFWAIGMLWKPTLGCWYWMAWIDTFYRIELHQMAAIKKASKQEFVKALSQSFPSLLSFVYQDSNFLSATGLLTGSVKRFSTMVRSGRDNRRILCYVSVGLVLVFFLLYYLVSRIQRWQENQITEEQVQMWSSDCRIWDHNHLCGCPAHEKTFYSAPKWENKPDCWKHFVDLLEWPAGCFGAGETVVGVVMPNEYIYIYIYLDLGLFHLARSLPMAARKS